MELQSGRVGFRTMSWHSSLPPLWGLPGAQKALTCDAILV